MERDVWVGAGRAEGDGRVLYVFEGRAISEARGFKGVTGRECWWYQARTILRLV